MGIRTALLFFALTVSAVSQNQLIIVHRQSMRLELFEDSVRISKYPIRVGKETRKTPLGKGIISEKILMPIFRYADPGPNKGNIVRFAECSGGIVRVDYKKMRALRMRYTEIDEPARDMHRRNLLPVGESRFSFHSVSCAETIGEAISKGCVGLSIPDMLQLYKAVRVDREKNLFPQFEVRDD